MDDNHHIQIMGILSSQDGTRPTTVFLEAQAETGEVLKAHVIENNKKEPILKHLGMYFDPGHSYGLDHPDFIYTAQLVIDYNEDLLYDPAVASVDNEQPTFKMMFMKVDGHDL